ncbi:IclR family transcriptional regulator [Phytohabitans aurantiacus]|uniref:IclR-ED domain-containing protein n=1 Tax=Phytohabitans aurantiacus TaxID=3016789 RepID=A0ABQ5R6S9_9ACTN|nr:IclR family transcriptional regulator C-terminal domain-containing protein [Phytohabitans aurantiacus]GLI02469.1 hypothetical protein Pa4123_77470 [Phytohabitans aurantiacus]
MAWRGLCLRDDGHYEIGQRLWEVGLLGALHLRPREIALPFLQTLYEVTRENVHLAVRDGDDVLNAEKLVGHRSVPIISRLGGRLPLHATGVGKALLAHESPTSGATTSPASCQAHPLHRRRTGPAQRRHEQAAQRRYAATHEEMTLGTCSIAVAILGHAGRPVAAVGAVVHSIRVEPANSPHPSG